MNEEHSGTAAKFAEEDGEIWLLHSGRIFGGNIDSTFDQKIQIDGRTFFQISRIDDRNFLSNIAKFHFSRVSVPAPAPPLYMADTGALRGGIRNGAIWEARHSKVVVELVGFLKKNGWVLADGSPWKPDIFAMSERRSFLLIEVKPDNGMHNIITAIGQLVCYKRPHREKNVKCVVAAPGEIAKELLEVIEDQGFLYINIEQDNYAGRLLELFCPASPRTVISPAAQLRVSTAAPPDNRGRRRRESPDRGSPM